MMARLYEGIYRFSDSLTLSTITQSHVGAAL
jgi:hypothetical protein